MGGNAAKETVRKDETLDKTPWAPTIPLWMNLYGKGSEALDKTNNNPFLGDYTAQATPDATAGINALRGNINSGAVGQGGQAFLDMATKTAAGGFMDPNTNPFIAQVANAALKPVTTQLTGTILPGIKDAAIAGGAYGGARQDVQENTAVDNWSKTAGDLTSNIFYNNYMQERNNQLGSGNLLEQGYGLINAGGKQSLGLDEAQRNLTQLGLTNALQKYQGQQTAPWYGLGELGQLLSMAGGGSAKGTTVADNPNYQDPFTQALKLGLGTAGAAASIGGSGGFKIW